MSLCFDLSHLSERSCWLLPADPQCLSNCTRYWSCVWASHRGESWPEVKNTMYQAKNTCWLVMQFLGLCSAANFDCPFPISCLISFFSLSSVIVRTPAPTGENGTTPSYCQQFRSWWKDTTATSGLISMVGVSLIMILRRCCSTVVICVLVHPTKAVKLTLRLCLW